MKDGIHLVNKSFNDYDEAVEHRNAWLKEKSPERWEKVLNKERQYEGF